MNVEELVEAREHGPLDAPEREVGDDAVLSEC
jgi:hypothetical protein